MSQKKQKEREHKAQPISSSDKNSAGAGLVGLLGFIILFFISVLFFITENYFISMFIISIGLMVYVTGKDIVKIFVSSFAIFFSTRHLIEKAAYIQENLPALKRVLKIRKPQGGFGVEEDNVRRDDEDQLEDEDGKGSHATMEDESEMVVMMPQNELSTDITNLLGQGHDIKYAEFVAHSYYVECHELYGYTRDNLQFVGNAMPLFGLIGTILGLIAMFDSLGANVTVESLAPQLALALKTTLYGAIFSSLYNIIASRFEQRIKILEYDYETFCYGLDVIFETKTRVGVKQ